MTAATPRRFAGAIDVHYAAVSEFRRPPLGHVLAVWERDRVTEDFEFDVATSPAAAVLGGGLAHFPSGVSRRFPAAAFLSERSIEGYISGFVIRHSSFGPRPLKIDPLPRVQGRGGNAVA